MFFQQKVVMEALTFLSMQAVTKMKRFWGFHFHLSLSVKITIRVSETSSEMPSRDGQMLEKNCLNKPKKDGKEHSNPGNGREGICIALAPDYRISKHGMN